MKPGGVYAWITCGISLTPHFPFTSFQNRGPTTGDLCGVIWGEVVGLLAGDIDNRKTATLFVDHDDRRFSVVEVLKVGHLPAKHAAGLMLHAFACALFDLAIVPDVTL